MRFISAHLGAALQLLAMDEIWPPSGIHFPTAFAKITERYQFLSRPTDPEKIASGTGKFVAGHIVLGGREIAIGDLSIYSDGFNVETLNTGDADLVLNDFLAWLSQTFGTRQPTAVRTRVYRSVVVVEFGRSIDVALKHFSMLQSACAGAWQAAYGYDILLSLERFALEADPASVPPYTNTKFVIERRANTPFSANRYYCGAPLPTIAHLRLLEQIEKTLLDE
jgi:hypothetical protein